MQFRILIALAVVWALLLLFVPQREASGSLSYAWVFSRTEWLDLTLLLIEMGVAGLLAGLAFVFAHD